MTEVSLVAAPDRESRRIQGSTTILLPSSADWVTVIGRCSLIQGALRHYQGLQGASRHPGRSQDGAQPKAYGGDEPGTAWRGAHQDNERDAPSQPGYSGGICPHGRAGEGSGGGVCAVWECG